MTDSTTTPDGRDRPLAGRRVLDLSRMFPGAFCTQLLADLGAEVIRVEAPDGNDPVRGMPGGLAAYQRGKRSLALDLKQAAAADVVRRLFEHVDVVVVETALPRPLLEAGISYETAAAVRPALIWCAIPAFGQGSPYASRTGHDIAFLGYSGLLALMAGSAVPATPDFVLASPIAALFGCIGILAALSERDRTGVGRMVESTLVDGTMWVIGEQIARVAAGGQAGWGEAASRRAYRAADGKMITLSAAEPRTWSAFCAGLDRPDLEPRLRTDAAGQDALREELEGIFLTRTAAEWVAHFDGTAAAVGPVLTVEDLLVDDHVVARGSIVDLARDSEDQLLALRPPVRAYAPDGSELTNPLDPPPALGADTDAVLAAAGLTADEIAALRRDGVIGASSA
jgi:crotonobetainyl-CoA:carnitine CoA-transferase CaiB-like acyl-CoA transferase